eukprot:scaffold3626_cov69-Skeletonema_dohrnii-CCMP3373.AAC.6
MRSPSALLAFIGCVAVLFPQAALGRTVPVYVYRTPPTYSPTSSPSVSFQPSLRPTLPPASSSSITSNLALASSPTGNWWIAFLVGAMLCFAGAMYKLDKKQKLKRENSTPAEEEPEEEPAAEENKDGWFAWLWSGREESVQPEESVATNGSFATNGSSA